MSYAIKRVNTDSVANSVAVTTVARRNVDVGQGLVTGKTREKARKAAGISDAVANATRPQASVWTPLSTPPMPSTHPAMQSVSPAKRRFVLLSRAASQI